MDFMNKGADLSGPPPPPLGSEAPSGFDDSNPKYICFRNRYHVTQATQYIVYFMIGLTGFYAVVTIFSMIIGSGGYLRDAYGENYVGVVLLAILLEAIVLGCAMFGLRREKRHYLMPFMIVTAIGCVSSVIKSFVSLTLFGELGAGAFFLFLLYVLITILMGYFFYIVLLCHDYWGNKQLAQEIAARVAAEQGGQQPGNPAGNVGIQQQMQQSYDYQQQQQPQGMYQPTY